MSFASRLRQAREQSGFTQQDLAEKLGVTKSAVGNYENGVSSPKWDVLLKILTFFRSSQISCTKIVFLRNFPGLFSSPLGSLLCWSSFDQLNEEGQTKAVEYVEDLVLTGRYKKWFCSLTWAQKKRK